MKAEDIIYKTKAKGYTYVYDITGFISVYDVDNVEDLSAQAIHIVKATCKSKKDFETEIIHIQSCHMVEDNFIGDE